MNLIGVEVMLAAALKKLRLDEREHMLLKLLVLLWILVLVEVSES